MDDICRAFPNHLIKSADTLSWASVLFPTGQDMLLYLGENLCGALLHLPEMPLLKFLQPHPVALEEKPRVVIWVFIISLFLGKLHMEIKTY